MSALAPTISVVIIGRNEGARLSRCLASVHAAKPIPGGYELIYVDSASTDSSRDVAAAAGARVLSIGADRPTAAKARNAGWRAARGEWILFLDGDTILEPEFPALALQAARPASIAAVWGHRRELFPTANFFHRVLDLDWVYRPGITEFCGGDALMRRAALATTGGFDETLIAGEEPELCARLRALHYEILHIDAPMTLHDMAITQWRQYWRRASRAGYAYAQMSLKTREENVRLWANESRHNIRRAVLLALLVALAIPAPWLSLPLLAAVVVRTAWRARWKSTDWLSLLCYGAHSHLQQIPIFAGQVAFWRDCAGNRRRGLIEYK